MTTFRFLHAADIHLDSPLYGLSRYDGIPVDEVRGATRAAFDNLVQLAIDAAVDFVIIAGDLFDGEWRDMGTGLYFATAMGNLDRAEIPVFILGGNHDAASVITGKIPWPENVRQFSANKPETHILPDLNVALHGQSFPTAAVTDNLVLAYPEPKRGAFNIGVLHTALAGREGHANYAPCTLNDLNGKGYEYWALGHVHSYELVSSNPHVVFPGNTQGRSVRETGPKGAVIITVEDGRIEDLTRVDTDVLRWAIVDADCANTEFSGVADPMRAALSAVWEENAGRLPLIVRLTLIGTNVDAGVFIDNASLLRDSARAVAAAISPDLFIEKVKVNVRPPATKAPLMIDDQFASLIEQAGSDSGLAQILEADLGPFLSAVKPLIGNVERQENLALANSGDWTQLITTANAALRSRLNRTH